MGKMSLDLIVLGVLFNHVFDNCLSTMVVKFNKKAECFLDLLYFYYKRYS